MVLAPLFKPIRQRKEVLKDSVIRDFGGGWNVIDNEFNLSSRFAKVLDNWFRAPDGSLQVRWGTKFLADLSNNTNVTGSLGNDPFTTDGPGSAVVTVTHTAHGLIDGHKITFAGTTGPIDGIPASEFNAEHVVDVQDANSYKITLTTTATAGSVSGGGASVTFDHDNMTLTGEVVNMEYFQDHLIVVDDNGEIAKVDANGNSTVIWNDDIASYLSGSPSGWSATTFVSFASFSIVSGSSSSPKLVICNGVDKPLQLDLDNDPQIIYLQDPAGSNANTPVAKYVITTRHYCLMAGDPSYPDRVWISNYDTIGVWEGDPAPNDATHVDLGRVTGSSSQVIRGLSKFQGRPAAAFDDVTVLGSLGIYDDGTTGGTVGDHLPVFEDVIEKHGSLSHRAMQDLGNDLLMCDAIGAPSISRALIAGTFKPQRASELIDPEIQTMIQDLTIAASEDRIFSVYNQREGQYMLFIPNNPVKGSTTETTCFVYTLIESLKVRAWSRFKGWNFDCACRSQLGKIFFAHNSKIYYMASEDDQFHGDLIDDPDITDPDNGDEIAFTWELPWADFGDRFKQKQTRHILFDTEGTATFTCEMYVDNIVFDALDARIPQLTMDFVGAGSPGYGGGAQPYGGGRRTADEWLFAWPARFKMMKLRIHGSTTDPLKVIGIALSYKPGSIRR